MHVAHQGAYGRRRSAGRSVALGQFLGEMEDRQEQAGKGVVLQQVGVFQEAQEEVPVFPVGIFVGLSNHRLEFDTKIVFRQALTETGKIRAGPVANMGHPDLEVGEAPVVGGQGF